MQKSGTSKRSPRLNLEIGKEVKAAEKANDSFDDSCSSSDDFSNYDSDDDFSGGPASIQVMALQHQEKEEEVEEKNAQTILTESEDLNELNELRGQMLIKSSTKQFNHVNCN